MNCRELAIAAQRMIGCSMAAGSAYDVIVIEVFHRFEQAHRSLMRNQGGDLRAFARQRQYVHGAGAARCRPKYASKNPHVTPPATVKPIAFKTGRCENVSKPKAPMV